MSALTAEQRCVNFVRVALGKDPLYRDGPVVKSKAPLDYGNGYIRKEAWLRLASPSCTRCGGSGYRINVAAVDVPCECTGIVRSVRGHGSSDKTTRSVLRGAP